MNETTRQTRMPAGNKSIAYSGAGCWSNRQQFALVLLFGQEVFYLAFCFYLSSLKQNPAAVTLRKEFYFPTIGNTQSLAVMEHKL